MKYLAALIFSILFLIFAFNPQGQSNSVASESSCVHTSTQFSCVKYIKNYDGDTATFKIPNVHPLIGENISVRIRGIDTPEIRTKDACEKEKGRIAKNLLENLLKNAKRIDLKNISRDKYFRILSDIEFDGKDVKNLLLKNNLAYIYDGGTKLKINWCERKPATNQQ